VSDAQPTQRLPWVLLALYVILFCVCGIAPYDRAVWWAENLPIIAVVAVIAWFARRQRFSTAAWLFMAILPALHTIGGHYTFARVPFGFVTDLFGFERNHYDRMAHFTVGFYAYPMAELLVSWRLINARWIAYAFPLSVILAIAGIYELFEWQFAVLGDPDAGHAVLGSQGDVWDAQKDILADGLGAVFALGVFAFSNRASASGNGPVPGPGPRESR
jgi:putative membrane protein